MIRPARNYDTNPLNPYCYNYDKLLHHQGCLEPVEAHQGMMLLDAIHRHNNVETTKNNILHEAAGLMDSKISSFGNVHHHHHNHDMKKKRLSDEQLDALERSFREDIKLDPERKMKLSRELGMQPRQIAVWFQNRRARWKNKQLERMYDALKLDFDVVSREKLSLQEEVAKLRGIVRDRLMALPEEDAENLLALSKKQTVVVAAGEANTSHFSGANLGLEYSNISQLPILLSPNYWAAHQQQLPAHYPY